MREITGAACPFLSGDDIRLNAERLTAYMEEAARNGAGLIVFPEASLTGYAPDKATDLAIRADTPVLEDLAGRAGKLGLILSVGFMERADEGRFYLTQMITDGAARQFYRKTHLGCREREVFAAGDELPVFTAQGAQRSMASVATVLPTDTEDSGAASGSTTNASLIIGTHLCWESHIPEISTVFRAKGAELLLIPYASGLTGQTCRDVWNRHMPARASDNGCYVIACNALHKKADGRFGGGGSAVYDHKGRLIASHFEADETLLICELKADLPRDHADGDMGHISYFDRRRPELYRI